MTLSEAVTRLRAQIEDRIDEMHTETELVLEEAGYSRAEAALAREVADEEIARTKAEMLSKLEAWLREELLLLDDVTTRH